MDYPTTIIGVLAFGFALFTLTLTMANPHRLKKLVRMKEVLGKRAGMIVHALFYIALPMAFGGFCLISGVRGIALF